MPKPHILLSVTAPALFGRPPKPGLARRRLALPAIRQLPNSTSVTSLGLDAGALDGGADSHAAQIVRGEGENRPGSAHGVRAAPTMTMGSDIFSFQAVKWGNRGLGRSDSGRQGPAHRA